MSEVAPAEHAAAAEKKRPLLRRVPTSLLVTLLGIVLSAWILPAVTRQWEDRQKAHELAVALGTQMATSTANVLEQTRAELYREASTPITARNRSRSGPAAKLPKLETDWSVAGLRIEATLLASYSRELVERWRGLRQLVAGWIAWYDDTQVGWEPSTPHAKAAASIAVPVAGYPKPLTALKAMQTFNDNYLERLTYESQVAAGTVGHDATKNPVTYVAYTLDDYRVLEEILLAIEAGIAGELVDAHVKGYSTTAGDFLRDLVP
jgi:hypothetical protein